MYKQSAAIVNFQEATLFFHPTCNHRNCTRYLCKHCCFKLCELLTLFVTSDSASCMCQLLIIY